MKDISLWSVFILILIGFINSLILGLYSKEQRKVAALANLRSFAQLSLLSLVLAKATQLDSIMSLVIVLAIILAFATRTLVKRTKGLLIGYVEAFISIALSVFPNIVLGLLVIGNDQFLRPLFFIPFVGMLVGNSLNGLTLGLNSFFESFSDNRFSLIQSIGFGASKKEALFPLVAKSLKSGLTPILNTMLVVGIVSIPGMMTGQLIAGEDTFVAAKYQYFILVAIQTTILLGILIVAFLAGLRIKKHPEILVGDNA
ncbi:MAG: hypothetical protein CME64_06645 [Halobacteriovoraceae bacterium]|nr:hypothetical protein [Halobacteriovoraceae bacterium]